MTDLVADLSPVAPLTALIDTVDPLSAALTSVAQISGAIVTVVQPLSSSLTTVPALSGAVGSVPALSKSLSAVLSMTAEIGGSETDLWLAGIETGAGVERDDSIKLAAYNGAIGLGSSAPNFVELPTGLIAYPSFVDSGYLEFTLGAAFTPNGQFVEVVVKLGPANALVTIGTFTSPTFPVNAFASQWEFTIRIKNHGPTQGNYAARMLWTDGASATTTNPGKIDYVNRTFGFNFQDPATDQGDVEIRAEARVSGSGAFTIRNYAINQFCVRSGL